MRPASLFSQAIRTYVTSGKMPRDFSESLRINFDNLRSLGKIPKLPSAEAAKIWSEGMMQYLESQAAKGCVESRNLLDALEKFRSDPKNTGLIIEGAPIEGRSDEDFANHVTVAFANLLGFSHFSHASVESPRLIDSLEYAGAVPPHVDQPLSFPQIALFALTCLTSKSSAQTFSMDADRIYKALSKQAREVFEKERFACISTKKDQSLKIFDRDEDGELVIDFDFDQSDLVCRRVSDFGLDVIDGAVAELSAVVKDLYLSGEVDRFAIKEGNIFFGKNHRVMHGRDSLESSDEAGERVLSRLYFEKKPRADGVYTEADKVERVLKKSAAREVLE